MNLLKKIFSPTILTISFLLLLYTFYKSEIIWYGNNRNYYKVYYFISSILISFSIISFFINDKIKEYLIILIISLVVSLYLFEGYLTFKGILSKKQFSKEQLYEKYTNNKWDKRMKYEIYNDLKKTKDKITVSVHPSNFLKKTNTTSLLPLSGISNSNTINCNENGYYSIYQSDRYGFNNPDKEWDEKEIEYLIIGDSFAHGDCVNRPNDISSILRSLSNKPALNLGKGGNGPLIEYATLREFLDKNVKKVLWIYYEGNDLENLKNEKKYNTLTNYIKDLNFTQNLKYRQNEINDFLIKFIQIKNKRQTTFKFRFIKFIKIHNTRNLILNIPASSILNIPDSLILNSQSSLPSSTPTTREIAQEFKKIIKLTKKLTNKNNTKLYFIYLPEYNRYTTTYDNTNYHLVKNIVTELKIPFIDIHEEVFVNEQNQLMLFPFKLPGHYNVDGYKKVAETIYEFTKN